MKNLLAFVIKNYHWLMLLLLETVSGVLLFKYNSYQSSVWFSSANVVVGKVYEWDAVVRSFFSLGRVNEELTLRNFYLERQVTQLRRLYGDLTQDTSIVQRQQLEFLNQYQLIPAKVVSNTVNKTDNLITIDRGRADGVEKDMGVACGNGAVGVVYLVSDHYSVVIPVLNATSSHISCAIRGRGYFGYLQWYGGDPTVAYVEDIPRHARFKRGDWIETSGYSAIFPRGILVGKIEKIYNSADGLSYRLKIRLSTDFACLRDVVVISDKGIGERLRLQEEAKDSITMSPNK
ncbi:MAG: rod shape-determining protein MreC [Prevotella sp.]|jgi:rod shape-determining protein MreC|nr:rod shape-determining protein MreC [Prevotella sp.]